MGWALIILTIVIRIVLLPVSFASDRSEQERHEIHEKYLHIAETYKSQPVKRDEMVRVLMRGNRRVLIAEAVMLIIQVIIAFMFGAGGRIFYGAEFS
jgi:YidC/Oxa1 family membrane protein insertase